MGPGQVDKYLRTWESYGIIPGFAPNFRVEAELEQKEKRREEKRHGWDGDKSN